MRYQIKILPKGESDIRGITEYLFEFSPQGAKSWLDAYREARLRLVANPEVYPLAPESCHFQISVRQLLFKTRHGRMYRMLFTIVEDEVRVLRLRGPGQAPVSPTDM